MVAAAAMLSELCRLVGGRGLTSSCVLLASMPAGSARCSVWLRASDDFGRLDGDSLRWFALGHFSHLRRRSERQPVGRSVAEVTPDEHDGDDGARDGVSGQPADRAGE